LKLIVGLGNPGLEYVWSRHNLGFMVVDALADQAGMMWKKSRIYHGWVARGQMADQPCRLLKPATFMNRSGQAVAALRGHLGLDLSDLLIVCDDFNLIFGQLRIRPTGSDGGHNGLESVIHHLKSKDFARLRIGIGAPAQNQDVAEYVLSEFRRNEKKELGFICDEAVACCMSWLSEGMAKTRNRFNKRKKEEGNE